MNRKLNEEFYQWLKDNDGKKILETIAQYSCLSICMNGTSLRIYFEGCRVLTVEYNPDKDSARLIPLTKNYYKASTSSVPKILSEKIKVDNLEQYLDAAIAFLSRRKNPRQEERIRQEICRVNNLGREANDTDYFIIDQEYGFTTENGKDCKFDLVAIKWLSTGTDRKSFKNSNIEIVVFELKLGQNAVGGTKDANSVADLKGHIEDFRALYQGESQLREFKTDIVSMLLQQSCLTGFFNPQIGGLKHIQSLERDKDKIKIISDIVDRLPVRFGFILADYKQESTRLKEQISQFEDDFLFATSSFMGYGLFDRNILNREQFLKSL